MVNLKIQLPKSFLDDEIRCKHLVTSEIKKVWAVELDLLAELDRVCKKHNLQYYADGGTLLGAARHKGFIPWDDDVDIAMMRKDYEKLCSIAPSEFSHPYFFQTEYSDFGSLRGHAQLRNSQTTAILGNKENVRQYNQGIFIDIFPLDAIPDNKFQKRYQKMMLNLYKRLYLLCAYSTIYYNGNSQLRNMKIKTFIHNHFYEQSKALIDVFYKKYERICSKYNNKQTKYLCLFCFGYEILRRERSKYAQVVELDFENRKLPAPYQYVDVLALQYGDWKKYVIGKSFHGNVFFDTEHSYLEYLTKNSK